MINRVVRLALKILDIPEGPDHKTLQREARAYLKALSKEEYERFKEEALTKEVDSSDDYIAGLELFGRLCFTPKEAQAYAGMRINSPGVRRVIARRALLMKLLKRDTLPVVGSSPMSFYEVARMEDSMFGDMSSEQILGELRHGARRS